MNFASFIVRTIANEIIEDLKIIKDIAVFHYEDRKNQKKLKKLSKRLRKKLANAKNYEEWKNLAL